MCTVYPRCVRIWVQLTDMNIVKISEIWLCKSIFGEHVWHCWIQYLSYFIGLRKLVVLLLMLSQNLLTI